MTTLPLYAIPGLMNDARVWANQQQAFSAEREVRVAGVTGHDSVSALAAAALANAPAGRFALAAFSLGGYVAFEMLRQAPERVAALALLDTGARPDAPESIAMRERMIAAVGSSATSFNAVSAAFLPRVIHPSRVNDEALVSLLNAMAITVGAYGFVRQQRAAITRPDSRSLLSTITCPTLVLCGQQDQITPLELSEEMASLIPGARLVVVEGCGHMSLLEHADAVNAAMAGWLAIAEAGL